MGGSSRNRHRVGCGCSGTRARPTYSPPLTAKGKKGGQKKKDLIIDLTSSRSPPLVFPSHVGRLLFLAQRYDMTECGGGGSAHVRTLARA